MHSTIESVLVYRRGALVTRVAQVDAAGEVRLTGLPLCLDDASLSTRCEGGVAAVSHKVELDFQQPPPVDESVHERLRQLSVERNQVQARLDEIRKRLKELSTVLGVPPLPTGQGEGRATFSFQARRELVQLRQGEQSRLGQKNQELSDRLKAINQEMTRLNLEIRKSSLPEPERLSKAVRVTLEGSSGGGRLYLSYRVPGVRWAPSYTFRFDKELSLAEMLMRVSICQATGEDWNGVKLQVSTADPAAWRELPELPSKRIGKLQPTPPKAGWRPPPLGTEELFADYDRGPGRPPDSTLEVPPPPPEADYDKDLFIGGAFAEEAVEEEALFGSSVDYFSADEGGGLFDEPEPEMMMMRSRAMPVAASLPPAASAPAPKPTLAKKRKAVSPPGGGGGSFWEPDLIAGDLWGPQLEVGSEHLDYGLLRMPGPQEFGRGKLAVQSAVDACLSNWQGQGFNPRELLHQALNKAGAHRGAPGSLRFPSSVAGFDFLYPGEVPVDVPSDGQFHSVPLLTHTLSAQKHLVCVPRVTLDVFRLAEIESLPDLALPAGPVDVLVGGDYLLTSDLDNVVPGGSVRLGLGVEQGLKVVRNTRFKESTSGMMNGKLHLTHDLSVEVSNQTAGDVRLEVRERLPETAKEEKDIKVELESAEPDWERMPATEREHYRWSLRLSAGEQRELKARYVVTMPAKLELVGGNRREA